LLKKIYDNFYPLLPKPVQNQLTKLIFEIANKPFVKNHSSKNFPGGCKGAFVMSADFELAWAWRYSKTSKNPLELAIKKSRQSRKNFPVFLKQFDDYKIAITFATVGHLFLESCKKEDHSWMAKVPHFNDHWNFTKGDWFDYDPCSNYKEAPEWYAPDLIEKILSSKVKHEIGCHSFTHMHFRDDICPAQVADDEIKACVDAAKKWGIELKSIVFPGGNNGNYKALVKHGFTNYRENTKYDLFYPEIDLFNLVRLPSSLGLIHNEFNWSKEYYLYRYKKYIDKAIETGTVCHMWFHPSEDPWIISEIFPEILKYVAEKREKGLLYVATMAEISDMTKQQLLIKHN
jgi:peptidoglycan/xylan/chitin deacetylase (PgdA/CDA1 family)